MLTIRFPDFYMFPISTVRKCRKQIDVGRTKNEVVEAVGEKFQQTITGTLSH